MKIGIFDTGKGGEIVAERLKTHFPDAEFMIVNDRENLPYGSRTSDEIHRLTKSAITPLIGNCDVLVLACNTATAAAIDKLRTEFPKQQFVGYEPMVKPAAELTNTGCITILATPATLASERYKNLVAKYASNIRIFTPDATTWARDIEAGKADTIELGTLTHCVDAKTDIIVLACTHYLALEKRLRRIYPDVTIIEPTGAVAQRIKTLVSRPQQ